MLDECALTANAERLIAGLATSDIYCVIWVCPNDFWTSDGFRKPSAPWLQRKDANQDELKHIYQREVFFYLVSRLSLYSTHLWIKLWGVTH